MEVIIKGMGICSPLGEDNLSFFNNIFSGKKRWIRITRFTKKWSIPAFFACAFDNPHTLQEVIEKALYNSLEDANYSKKNSNDIILICFATSNGMTFNSLKESIPKSNLWEKTSSLNFVINVVKKFFPNFKAICFNTACASGGDALAYAYRQLKIGRFKRAIVIGADIISPLSVSGFMSLGAMSKNGCKPFSNIRDGMSFGEGAACLFLETNAYNYGSKYASVLGVGQYNDDYHITAPDPVGRGLSKAMLTAIKMAKVSPLAINYVNAHGTGTILNDDMEARALKSVFKKCMPKVSSTKSQIGHTLGAAGVFEAAVTAKAIEEHVLPPNLISKREIMDSDLNLVTSPNLSVNINYALSNSAGFGGNEVSIIFGKVNKNGKKIKR